MLDSVVPTLPGDSAAFTPFAHLHTAGLVGAIDDDLAQLQSLQLTHGVGTGTGTDADADAEALINQLVSEDVCFNDIAGLGGSDTHYVGCGVDGVVDAALVAALAQPLQQQLTPQHPQPQHHPHPQPQPQPPQQQPPGFVPAATGGPAMAGAERMIVDSWAALRRRSSHPADQPAILPQPGGTSPGPARHRRGQHHRRASGASASSDDERWSCSPPPQSLHDVAGLAADEFVDQGLDMLAEYTGPMPATYGELTEEQIATVSFRNFTKMMTKSGLTDAEMSREKRRRRRIKNRLSARQCSVRKRSHAQTTVGANTELRDRVVTLAALNTELQEQQQLLRRRCAELQHAHEAADRDRQLFETENRRLRLLLQGGGSGAGGAGPASAAALADSLDAVLGGSGGEMASGVDGLLDGL